MSLPEYQDNLYMEGLPPIEGRGLAFERLSRPPSWEQGNLSLSPVLRRHCVQRLKRYYRPGRRHLIFAEEFGIMMRNGYIGREPVGGRHEAMSLEIADQARDGLLLSAARPLGFENNAESALFRGMPGMGKTSVVKEVLRSYPPRIEHPGYPTQIPYVRLDTPAKGSLRSLCVEFFGQVDGLLGQESYTRMFAGQHATEETMLNNMALVARFHGLGCLVIDEIQHLLPSTPRGVLAPRTGEQDHALLTFLVTLTNKMGVPVLFVGTMNAGLLFERTARMARRAVGSFGEPWERYAPDDGQWKDFLNDLWQYSWLKGASPLDEQLRQVMYDETQGVVDLAVKLFTRVQLRLILRSESNPVYSELIEPEFIREVAKRDFAPVQGFVDALRSGDRDKINAFDDLADFKRTFDEATDQLADQQKVAVSVRCRRDDPDAEVEAEDVASLAERTVRAELREEGREADVIDKLIAQAKIDLGDDAPKTMALFKAVRKLLTAKSQKKSGLALVPENLVEGDLRKLARDAAERGRLVREALADAGLGGAAALKLAA